MNIFAKLWTLTVEPWKHDDGFVNNPAPYDAQIFEGESGYVPSVCDSDHDDDTDYDDSRFSDDTYKEALIQSQFDWQMRTPADHRNHELTWLAEMHEAEEKQANIRRGL